MYTLINRLKELNILLDVIDDNLDITAPKGVMNQELLDEIKTHKEDLIRFLSAQKSGKKVNYESIDVLPHQDDYVLSSSQYRLWVLNQTNKASTVYNISSTYKITGELCLTSLQKSFDSLLERHEVLRTNFIIDRDGNPRQKVRSITKHKFVLDYVDLSNENDIDELTKNNIYQESNFEFDLALDSLFRVKLLKISKDDYVFNLVMHHIISDGWSIKVLRNEIFTLYNAYINKYKNPLIPLQVQYKDYASWQQKQLKNNQLEESKRFWLEEFDEKPVALEIPVVKLESNVKNYEGSIIHTFYDKKELNTFKHLCEKQGATLYMGLLALVKLLLFKYSNQKDITVGSPVSGREHPELLNQIGFYVNLIGLRTVLNPNESFLELLSKLRGNILEAYNHQGYPFDQLLEDLDLSGNTLFDIVLNLENNQDQSENSLEISGLKIEEFNLIENKSSKFGLEFTFQETEQGLNLFLSYNSAIYAGDFVERMSKHLEVLMHSIILSPESSLEIISFLSKKEKEVLLVDFNDTKVSYQKGMTFLELFKKQVDKTPEAVVIVDGKEKLTYKELDLISDNMAHYLTNDFNVQGDLIGVKLNRNKWLVISMLGILKSGGAYLPIDPDYPKERIAYIKKDSNCKIIVDEKFVEVFADKSIEAKPLNIVLKPNDLAYVIYTSGSTGNPKGVMIEHRGLVNLCHWHIDFYKTDCNSKATLFSGTGFDASVWEICPYLISGGTLFPISDHDTRININKLHSFLLNNAITHSYLPTQICQNLVEDEFQLEGITIVTGGDVLKLSKETDLTIYNNYGPTENTVVTTSFRVDSETSTGIPIGKPISNTSVYILDEALNLLPVGFIGKLFVSGENIARGYLNQPNLTKEKFIENPFLEGEKMYDTGDLAYWLPDGNIMFAGRADEQVKIRGFRVELGEIEQVLIQQTAIKQAIVSVKNILGQKQLVAYVLSEEKLDKQEIKKELQKKLPAYMVPSCFMDIERVPLTANGKIDKRSLPLPTENDFIDDAIYVEPSSILEKQLANIWKEVLGISSLSINSSLFDLGGSSISIAKIINKIKSETEFVVAFKDVFENPTIRGIIPFLTQNTQNVEIPIATKQDYYPITSAQLRFWLLCQMPEVNRAYNVPFTIKLKGDLNKELLAEAFHLLIERHEILRTSFVQDSEGEIKQEILSINSINFNLEILELFKDKDLNDKISEFNSQEFDLAKAPLIKARIISTAESCFYLSIIAHHIVFDGHSLKVLIKELSTIYNNLLVSLKPQLSDLKIQFKDYAIWNNDVSLNNATKQHEFWMNELSGELPIINIPTYQNRPQIQTFKGDNLSYVLKNDLLRDVNKFSKSQKTTDFTVLLAALKGLLYRYTNQTDIIIGTPVLGRDHKDLEDQIGLYINTIPIRTRFDKSDDFYQLVDNQKNTLSKAYANSEYSFGNILNGLKLHRDTSRSPVFDVLVIYQKQNENDIKFNKLFDGVNCKAYNEVDSFVSKYDITFSFLEFEGQLSINAEYNTDLYEQKFIERILVNFENFLKESIKNPTVEIQKTSYINEDQINELLNQFNSTNKNINFQKTVVDLFSDQALLSSDKTAVVCEGLEITYKELHQKSTQLAVYLNEKGVKSNTTVGLFLGRSLDLVIAILGILKSGASYLPLDPFYPINRTDYILENSDTQFIITSTQTKDILNDNLTIIDIDDQSIWNQKGKTELTVIDPSSMAYVIYTSGSTGKPKGVKVSHKNLTNFIAGMNDKFVSRSNSDVWLAMTSISFDISILELLWTLTEGNKIILHLERPVPVETKPEMKFSLFYFPTYNNSLTSENKYKLLLEGAKFADENQFEAIWVPERHFHNFGDQFPNPSVAAAAVSTITKNIRLRSGSVVLPLHDPIRVAEEWSMVDNLSEGRVELSIASGWHPNDFVLAPDSYENRHQVMRQGINTLKEVWKGKTVTRKNGVGKEFEFYVHPKPIQNELPLWVTAAGSIETFKYAGTIGANILTHLLGQSIENLEEKIKVYRQTLLENGYNSDNYKVSLMLHTFVSDNIDLVKETVEEPFKDYLKNSINLLKPIAEELELDLDNDLEPLLDIAYQRFYNTSSLFGTPESCQKMINRVYEIGIDEVACLIDFGVDNELVIDNLCHLFDLKEVVKRSKAQQNFIVKTINKLTEEESTAQLINDHKVTHIQSTPSLYEELLLNDEGREALKNIKTLLVGGEALKKSLAQKLIGQVGTSIHNMYGPTETTIWSSIKTVGVDEDINIGTPIANTKIYVLDINNQLCPVGVSGELCIGGDGVSLGYLNKEELTKERFIDNPFEENQKIYKTGDLARWLPNGELQYLGRLDSQVKIKGYRIELKEIENVFLDHESVMQCAVSTFQENNQTSLTAYIKTSNTVDNNVLKEFIRLRLPHYMIPHHIVILEEFPQTPNGKTDYKALPKPNGTTAIIKSYTPPGNEAEKKLCGLWADFLEIEEVGIDDNFFEIGGNSMKAFQLLSLMNSTLNTDLKIISFFQYPTIRTLLENLNDTTISQKVQIEENEMEDVEDLIDFMNEI